MYGILSSPEFRTESGVQMCGNNRIKTSSLQFNFQFAIQKIKVEALLSSRISRHRFMHPAFVHLSRVGNRLHGSVGS
jgi:hypothetical protein